MPMHSEFILTYSVVTLASVPVHATVRLIVSTAGALHRIPVGIIPHPILIRLKL